MRRIAAAVVVLWCLGCAGLTEQAMELGAGGQVEISEDGGMVWHMENGAVMRTAGGPNAKVPPEMPMPPPWPDAPPTSVTTVEPPDAEYKNVIVTYEMERTKDEIKEGYEGWYGSRELEYSDKEESSFGTWVYVMEAKETDGTQAVVSMSDAFGMSSVTLMYGRELDKFSTR